MTERNPPVWMQTGTYNAVDDRMITGMLSDRTFNADGSILTGIEGGVVPPYDQLRGTVPGNSMTMAISGGAIVIPTRGTTPPGAYICYNEGSKSFTFDIESTGNPRLDVVYAEVIDVTTGGASSLWQFGVKKGTPSASPTTPVLTGNQVALYQVRVIPAAQNGGVNKILSTQLTDLRRFNTAQGAVHITKNGTPNPAHTPGRLLYNVDSDFLYISNGTTWEHYLSYEDWMDIFATVRPRHAGNISVQMANITAHDMKWTPNPRKYNSTATAPTCALTGMRSPSGAFKVSISSRARVDGNAVAGHMSIRVLQGATTKFTPSGSWRAISFYHTNWEHHGTTFLVTGMPANTDLIFRQEFYKDGGAGSNGNAWFLDSYMMVEPYL